MNWFENKCYIWKSAKFLENNFENENAFEAQVKNDFFPKESCKNLNVFFF